MEKNKFLIRKAKKEDSIQIAAVLLDFYNMDDQEEAKRVFFNETISDFYYLEFTLY